MENISVIAAFVAGLTSFLLPCVLPLAPIYMAILAGPEILEPGADKKNVRIFLHSLTFVAGFSVVFVGLGAGAGLAGLAISINFFLIKQVAGIILIVFGALFLLSQKVPQLNFQKRLTPSQSTKTGYIRSFATGAIFSMASMTCATYILGGILMLAAASATACMAVRCFSFSSTAAPASSAEGAPRKTSCHSGMISSTVKACSTMARCSSFTSRRTWVPGSTRKVA